MSTSAPSSSNAPSDVTIEQICGLLEEAELNADAFATQALTLLNRHLHRLPENAEELLRSVHQQRWEHPGQPAEEEAAREKIHIFVRDAWVPAAIKKKKKKSKNSSDVVGLCSCFLRWLDFEASGALSSIHTPSYIHFLLFPTPREHLTP